MHVGLSMSFHLILKCCMLITFGSNSCTWNWSCNDLVNYPNMNQINPQSRFRCFRQWNLAALITIVPSALCLLLF